MSTWLKSPAEKYGGAQLASPGPVTRDATGTDAIAPVVLPKAAGFLNPNDPMFWFAVIAAAGFGLMAYSTYVPVVG